MLLAFAFCSQSFGPFNFLHLLLPYCKLPEITFDRYEPKFNLLSNFWCRPPLEPKFHPYPSNTFENETDIHTGGQTSFLHCSFTSYALCTLCSPVTARPSTESVQMSGNGCLPFVFLARPASLHLQVSRYRLFWPENITSLRLISV
jgi:hypothetical protein